MMLVPLGGPGSGLWKYKLLFLSFFPKDITDLLLLVITDLSRFPRLPPWLLHHLGIQHPALNSLCLKAL